MPDIGIDLEGAWPPIPQVIQGRGEPAGHDAEHCDQGQGSQHPYAEEDKRMHAKTSSCRLLWPWRMRERSGHGGGTAYPGCSGSATARLGSIERVLLKSVITGLWLAHPRGPLHREDRRVGASDIFVHGDCVSSGR